jgi:hypothetical protein
LIGRGRINFPFMRGWVANRSINLRLCSMSDLIGIFTERGDLAHLALLLWAFSAKRADLVRTA